MISSVAYLALAAGAYAAPTHVFGGPGPVNDLAIPVSDFTVPIVAAVPRSARKAAQLNQQIEHFKSVVAESDSESHLEKRWPGDGSTGVFFGPGSGVEYAVNISVVGQTVSVIFDTGSSDLWFPSSTFVCTDVNGTVINQTDCNFGPTLFDLDGALSSNEIAPVNFSSLFNISYGDGETALGSAFIGAVEFAGVTVSDTEFSVVNTSYWEGDGVTDGLIGFANPLLTSVFNASTPIVDGYHTVVEYYPWFYKATQEGYVAPYFSIALNRVSIAEEGSDNGEAVLQGLGTVTLGGVPSNETVPLNGVNVTVPNELFNVTGANNQTEMVPAYYTIAVDSWNYEGSDMNSTYTHLAILDSGTTLIYAPDWVTSAFNAMFDPPAVYNSTYEAFVVPCNASVPDLSITIAGTEFPFTKEDLIYAQNTTENICISSLVSGGTGYDTVFILGDRFLVNNVVTFNVESNEITLNQRVPY